MCKVYPKFISAMNCVDAKEVSYAEWNQFPGGSPPSLEDILEKIRLKLEGFKGGPVLIGAIVAVVIVKVEINDPWNRAITAQLYTGDFEQRLRQEIVLGHGGAAAAKEFLGINHYLLHLNEGHAAFALLERIRETVSAGKDFAAACEKNINATIFTTHSRRVFSIRNPTGRLVLVCPVQLTI